MESPSIILFDGDCALCSRAVQFILKRDKRGRFQFASLQSGVAASLLAQAGSARETLPDSIVLLEEGKVSLRSTAALRIARHLNGLWPLAYGLVLVPAGLRDFAYDLIARNRYRLFGKRTACLLPPPEIRGRFLN